MLSPRYSPYWFWPYYGSAFGFGGLGLFGLYDDYDPFWSGYSYGYRGSYAYGLTGTYPGYSAYGYAPDPFDARGPRGGLRLRIQPKDAEVFVDGYYAGIVDEFDGHFQHLDLVPGPHHVEVYAPGYEPLKFDVNIQPHHTTQYEGRLTPTAR